MLIEILLDRRKITGEHVTYSGANSHLMLSRSLNVIGFLIEMTKACMAYVIAYKLQHLSLVVLLIETTAQI